MSKRSILFGLFGSIIGAILYFCMDVNKWQIGTGWVVGGGIIALVVDWMTRAKEDTRLGRILASIWPLPTARRQVLGGGAQELDSFEVDYIYDIRRRSHETEIIITIGLYAALLSIEHRDIDDVLWTFSGLLPYGIVLVLSQASFFALWTLRMGMTAHLILRSIWIGLVGLGFTYPRGISNSALGSALHRRSYKYLATPDAGSRLTLAIERLCSVVYGVWLSCLFALIAWTVLIVLSYWSVDFLCTQFGILDDSAYRYLLLIFFVFVIFSSWTFFKVSQNNGILALRYPIIDIVHFFRGAFLAYSPLLRFFVVCFPTFCIVAGVLSTRYYDSDRTKYTYIDQLIVSETLNRPALNSWIIERDYTEIYLPQKYLAELRLGKDLRKLASKKTQELKKILNENKIFFYLNTVHLTELEWLVIMLGDVPVLFTVLPLANLENGIHNLYIKGQEIDKEQNKLLQQENTAIPFYFIGRKEGVKVE